MTTLACKEGVQDDACDSPLVKTGGITCTLTCSRASANEPCPGGQEEVIIFHAGSLTNAFTPLEREFVCQTGIQVIDCQGGSLDLARALTAGGYAAACSHRDYYKLPPLLQTLVRKAPVFSPGLKSGGEPHDE